MSPLLRLEQARQTKMQRELRQALRRTVNQRLQNVQERHRIPRRWLGLREQEQQQKCQNHHHLQQEGQRRTNRSRHQRPRKYEQELQQLRTNQHQQCYFLQYHQEHQTRCYWQQGQQHRTKAQQEEQEEEPVHCRVLSRTESQ